MLEYILCFVALLVVFAAMGRLVWATKKSVDRTESLIRSDYP